MSDTLAGFGHPVGHRLPPLQVMGGILVGLVDRSSATPTNAGAVRGRYMLAHPGGAQLAEISRLIDSGHVRPTVDAVYSLKEASKAHEHGQQGHTRGKIVLQVADKE